MYSIVICKTGHLTVINGKWKISLLRKVRNIGPSIKPCGTPVLISYNKSFNPLTLPVFDVDDVISVVKEILFQIHTPQVSQ